MQEEEEEVQAQGSFLLQECAECGRSRSRPVAVADPEPVPGTGLFIYHIKHRYISQGIIEI